MEKEKGLLDISSNEDSSEDKQRMEVGSGLSEVDMIPDLNNTEDPIEVDFHLSRQIVLKTGMDFI